MSAAATSSPIVPVAELPDERIARAWDQTAAWRRAHELAQLAGAHLDTWTMPGLADDECLHGLIGGCPECLS